MTSMTRQNEIKREFNKVISAVGKLQEYFNDDDATMSEWNKIVEYARLLDEIDFYKTITGWDK